MANCNFNLWHCYVGVIDGRKERETYSRVSSVTRELRPTIDLDYNEDDDHTGLGGTLGTLFLPFLLQKCICTLHFLLL